MSLFLQVQVEKNHMSCVMLLNLCIIFRKRHELGTAWIDGKHSEAAMRWSTGREVSAPNVINRTLNAPEQDSECLQMEGNVWDDNDCQTVHRFVCEKPNGKKFIFT